MLYPTRRSAARDDARQQLLQFFFMDSLVQSTGVVWGAIHALHHPLN